MAISNISSNLRPGVVTSTTHPTSPYHGQVIFETDTNRTLVWDNSAWVMIADTDQPPGLQLIETKTFSSQTSVSFTEKLTSEFRNYTILGNLYGLANDGLLARMRVGSTDTTTASYRYNQFEMSSSPVSVSLATGQTSWYISNFANSGVDSCAFKMTLFSPQVAGLTSYEVDTAFEWTSNTFYARKTIGQFDATTQFNGISFFASQAMVGTMSLYGYRN